MAMIVHGEMVAVVVGIVMAMHVVVPEMVKAMPKKSVAEKTVAKTVRTAAFGRSVDLGERQRQQTGRGGSDQLF